VEGIVPSRRPRGLAALAGEYHRHLGLPMILGETNLRGSTSDRATYLKHALEQCEQARAAGVPLDGFCWFGLLDSLDWSSLLQHCRGDIDPVGVIALDEDLRRRRSSMSESYAQAAAGTAARDLPAYRLTANTASWLSHLMPFMDHFAWEEAPVHETAAHARFPLFAVHHLPSKEAA
jgi:hypothetical protein